MSELEFRIPLVIPSQKNSKRIAINKRTGRPFVMSDQRIKDWRDEASVFLPNENVKGRVEIEFNFTHKDKRRHDLDNEVSSLLDLFVLKGLIEDDSCFIVNKITANFVGVDKDNYGVQVKIKALD